MNRGLFMIRYCPFCNERIDNDTISCSHCGESLQGMAYFMEGLRDIFSFTEGCVYTEYLQFNYDDSFLPSMWFGILGFGFLKIIDDALDYSKENIISIFNDCKNDDDLEDKLLNAAVYKDGEKLGFYNYSSYDINKLGSFHQDNGKEFNKYAFYDKVLNYLSSFDQKVTVIIENYKIYEHITFLHKEGLLDVLFYLLKNYELDESFFRSKENLKQAYAQFLDEFYKLINDDIRNSFIGEVPKILDYDQKLYPYLASMLINDMNFEKFEKISIFDPSFKDGGMVEELIYQIENYNPQIDIQVGGMNDILEYKSLYLSLSLFDDFLKYTPDNFIDLPLNEYDLIISDLIFESSDDVFSLLKEFCYEVENDSKLLFKFNSSILKDLTLEIDFLIYNDYLESIILLPPLYNKSLSDCILILNTNKPANRRNKFLLIDEFDNKTNIAKDQFLLDKIFHSYLNFEEYDNSKIINNSDAFIDDINFSDIYLNLDKDYEKINIDYNDFERMDNELTKTYELSIKKSNYFYDVLMFKIGRYVSKIENLGLNSEITKNNFLNYIKKNIYNYSDVISIDFAENHFNFHNLMYEENPNIDYSSVELKLLGDIALIFDISNDIFVKNMSYNHPELLKFTNHRNSLFMLKSKPLNGKKQVFYHFELEDEDEYKKNDYLEIVLIDENITKEYLYSYLNSFKCLNDMNYFSRGDKTLTEINLNFLRIPVPPIDEQKNVVLAVNRSKEFFNSIDLLENQFQNNILDYQKTIKSIEEFQGLVEFDEQGYMFTTMGRNWRYLYDQLLWPLAVTYLSVTKGSFEISEKAEKYVTLFEFVTAFLDIILISAIPESVYLKLRNEIWADKDSRFFWMSFGKWTTILENLHKIYREHDFSTVLEKQIFLDISSQKILEILNIAKDMRNDDQHGGIRNKYNYEDVIDILDPYLSDVFDILNALSGLKLYYVTGEANFLSETEIQYEVIELNGPCELPRFDDLFINRNLKPRSLYLYNPLSGDIMRINDNLMKFITIDRKRNNWALFIFVGTEVDKETGQIKAKYKCFQQIEDDKYYNIKSFYEDIRCLGYKK